MQLHFWCTWTVQENSAEANGKIMLKNILWKTGSERTRFYFRSFLGTPLRSHGGLSHAFSSVLLIIIYCGEIIHFEKKKW